jgi:uncharacterized repeat protein (TIGR03803 family)
MNRVLCAGFLAKLRIKRGCTAGWACLVAVLSLLAAAQSQSNRGTYEVLHTFTNTPDGGHATSGLLRDTLGNLYGTTSAGGIQNFSACPSDYNYCGVVFKIDTAGNETVLYSFKGQPDGATPIAGLIQDSGGNLFGTTTDGGTSGEGAVFKLDTAGNESVVYSFAGAPDGSHPQTVLVQDPAGNFYGTTRSGGTNNSGTIFKLDPTGKETVLYSFTGGADGSYPNDLLLDSSGNLYGTANSGGLQNCIFLRNVNKTTGCGTVFRLDANGAFTTLFSFPGDVGPDAARPLGGLIADAAGNLYGTTEFGGQPDCSVSSPGSNNKTIGCGTVFKFDKTGAAEGVLHRFVITDGAFPAAGLAIDPSGNLYGTTPSNVFELETSGNLTAQYDFTGGTDGGSPEAPLLRDSEGNLFGTTFTGGNTACGSGCGVVFELPATTSPVFNVVIMFTGTGTGTVTSSPSGISCPTDCISAFPIGTTVTFTATPTGGSTFGIWSGTLPGLQPCTTTNANVCTVNSTQVVDAVFVPPPPDFSVSASAFTPVSVNPGGSATSTITTTALGGFSGSITLSCTVQSSVALAPTCSVSPASVNVGTTSKLTVSTTGPTASMVSPFGSGLLYATWMPVLGLMVGGTSLMTRSRTRKVRFRLVCMLLAGLLFQMACGGGGNKGTPAGTYTIVLKAVSGSLQHSVNPNPTFTVQ